MVSCVLPCVFEESLVRLREELVRAAPELVICVGQGGGQAAIVMERVALNVDDAAMPDNRGARPEDEPIDPAGPVGYWSTLPIKKISRRLNEAGIACVVSQSAGTFVCNHVFYGLMRELSRAEGIRGGFVHVPLLPSQAKSRGQEPGMPLEQTVRGLALVIETSLAAS